MGSFLIALGISLGITVLDGVLKPRYSASELSQATEEILGKALNMGEAEYSKIYNEILMANNGTYHSEAVSRVLNNYYKGRNEQLKDLRAQLDSGKATYNQNIGTAQDSAVRASGIGGLMDSIDTRSVKAKLDEKAQSTASGIAEAMGDSVDKRM